MSDLLLYGAQLDAPAVERAIAHMLEVNLRTGASLPVCIWGTHGIGKTALVEQLAQKHGWKFAYAAPAQFEEMGDLHGLPVSDGTTTRFAPPDWVPTEPGPGILLLDDLNRADDRILRGLMQLLQRGEMVSWGLPEGWQIVATANPEGGDYSVTPMDDAMLTRLLHVSMRFDAKAWARWAIDAGVDPRGVNFVLCQPEVVTGRRSTPRSLTQFFAQIAEMSDLVGQSELVYALAMSALDLPTVAAFQAFVADGMERLLEPEDILDAEDFTAMAGQLRRLGRDESGVRIDRLATIATRLHLFLTASEYVPTERHQDNLVAFLLLDVLPNDLRATMHRDLVREASDAVVAMVRDPRLAELVLAAL